MPSTMYRKRPVDGSTICKAFRWYGELVEGFERIAVGKDELSAECYNLVVPTPMGVRYAVEGDWIIRDFDGGLDICDPAVFDVDYVPYIPPATDFSAVLWSE
jgi:hypothetical protein